MNTAMKFMLAVALATVALGVVPVAAAEVPVAVAGQAEVQRACKGPTGRLVPCPKPGLPAR